MNQAIIHIAVPILDSLACSACLVDKKGTILAVNHHWIKFAKENYGSAEAVSEGANYLIACETERADDEPAAFGHGLRQVLKGQRLRYQHKYPCHSPNEYRWYRATVQQMEIEHFQGAIVLHENITDEVIKEREVTLMLDISKAIQEADSLTEAIYQTLRLICENSEWPVGEAWLTSESSDGQLFSDIHYLEKETFKPICEAKKGLKFYKGVGFPGGSKASAGMGGRFTSH